MSNETKKTEKVIIQGKKCFYLLVKQTLIVQVLQLYIPVTSPQGFTNYEWKELVAGCIERCHIIIVVMKNSHSVELI
jgi:hypothetical protein